MQVAEVFAVVEPQRQSGVEETTGKIMLIPVNLLLLCLILKTIISSLFQIL
jgi:hypothetical protein